MDDHALLDLDLRSPLRYWGMENPPFAGAPLSGKIPLRSTGGGLTEVALGEGLAEGEEELIVFDEVELVHFDAEQGPLLARPLPPPRFYGRSASGGGKDYALPRGSYVFMQYRPREAGEFEEGIEWFAREAWWEGKEAAGPYLIRRLKEHGKLAVQILRRLRAANSPDPS
jgi:hypothetical protein